MPRYRTYTLRIEETRDETGMAPYEIERLDEAIQGAQDVVNDALPDGFYCKIDESGEGVDLAAVRRLEEMS